MLSERRQLTDGDTFIEIPDGDPASLLKSDAPPLVCLAWHSYNQKRSPSTFYVAACGLEGSAKSAVLNKMFRQDSLFQTTDTIREYTASVAPQLVGISNLKMTVLDTAEYGSAAANYSAFKALGNYFNEKKYRPNIILVTASYLDSSLTDKQSNFARMLRDLRTEFRHAIDVRNPNVILVLTHVNSRIVLNPDFAEKVRKILAFARGQLRRTKIYVTAELEAMSRPKPSFSYLLRKLPNEKVCWLNMDLCFLHFKNTSGSFIGEALYKMVMVKGKQKLNFHSRPVPLVEKPATSLPNESVCKPGSGPEDKQVSTEGNIRFELESYVEDLMNSNANCMTPTNIPELKQKAKGLGLLMERLGCYDMEDLPKSDELGKLLKIICYLSERIDADQLDMLKNALALHPPNLEGIGIPLGRQYCLKTDGVKDRIVAKRNPYLSAIGCYLPENIIAVQTDEIELSWSRTTHAEYASQRMKQLGLQENVPSNLLQTEKPSLNSGYFVSDAKSTTVALIFQKSLYHLKLDYEKTGLDKRLETEMQQILEGTSPFTTSQDKWNRFFDEHGTHFVSEVELGACILFVLTEDCLAKMFSSTSQGTERKGVLAALFDVMSEKGTERKSSNVEFYVHGGTNVCFGMDVGNNLQNFVTWERSIDDVFLPLNRTLKVDPITALVKPEWKKAVHAAVNRYIERRSEKVKKSDCVIS